MKLKQTLKHKIGTSQSSLLLTFVQVSDSCGCILEGHPEREALLLTYSIWKSKVKCQTDCDDNFTLTLLVHKPHTTLQKLRACAALCNQSSFHKFNLDCKPLHLNYRGCLYGFLSKWLAGIKVCEDTAVLQSEHTVKGAWKQMHFTKQDF